MHPYKEIQRCREGEDGVNLCCTFARVVGHDNGLFDDLCHTPQVCLFKLVANEDGVTARTQNLAEMNGAAGTLGG